MVEVPKSVNCLSIGRMMKAEELYYLENIDVGVMLKGFIDRWNILNPERI